MGRNWRGGTGVIQQDGWGLSWSNGIGDILAALASGIAGLTYILQNNYGIDNELRNMGSQYNRPRDRRRRRRSCS